MKTISFFLLNISVVSFFLLIPPAAYSKEKSYTKETTYLELSQHGNLLQEPVARVNGDTITVAELMSLMRKKAKTTLKRIDAALSRSIKEKSLNELIDEKIFVQHARSLNIKADPETINKRYANYKKRFKNDALYKSYLTTNGLTESDMLSQIENYLAVKELIKREVDDTIEITEEDIKKGYEVNISIFTQKEKVTINDIILFLDPDTIESEKKITAILAKIKKDPGNDLLKLQPDETFVVKGQQEVFKSKNAKLFEVAKTLTVGELKSTVDNHGIMHIIQLVQYIPEKVTSLEEARPVLKNKLEKKFKKMKLEELKARFRNNAKIEVLEIYNSFDIKE